VTTAVNTNRRLYFNNKHNHIVPIGEQEQQQHRDGDGDVSVLFIYFYKHIIIYRLNRMWYTNNNNNNKHMLMMRYNRRWFVVFVFCFVLF
jgi:hypothetical protein